MRMRVPNVTGAAALMRTTPAWLAAVLGATLLAGALAGCSSSKRITQPGVIPPLSSLTIDVQVDTLGFGDIRTFTVTAIDTNGATVSINPAWRSTNTGVFTVSGTGRVTAQGEGTATLVAEAGGQIDGATITVLPGGGWIVQTSTLSTNLNGVHFRPDGRRGWAVGAGGRIVATQDAGVTWTQQSSNTIEDLHGVWFVTSSEGWAVGNGATVRHTVNGGATWTTVVTGVAVENLFDVHFAHPDTGFAVGATGVVLRTVDGGTTWTRRTPTASNLNSVSFASAWHGWAVGDNGTIIGTHNAGASWFTVTPAVTAQNLRAVWRRSESRAWAAGLVGAAPRTVTGPDSTQWTLASAGASKQLYGVSFGDDMVGYAVGIDGTGAVLRSDNGGGSWQVQTSNSQFRLNDVFFIDAQRGWAVGNNGTIIHTARGGLN
jgi:photosystem II stability/assembly factor-like uncharacterized protein